jgi:hypothetical protein
MLTGKDGDWSPTNGADSPDLKEQIEKCANAEGKPYEEVLVDMMFAIIAPFTGKYGQQPVMRLVRESRSAALPYLWRRLDKASSDDLHLMAVVSQICGEMGDEAFHAELAKRYSQSPDADVKAKYEAILLALENPK